MKSESSNTVSLWMTSADVPQTEPIQTNLKVDVCVLGRGIGMIAIVVFGFLTGFAAPAGAAQNMPVSANGRDSPGRLVRSAKDRNSSGVLRECLPLPPHT